MSAVIYCRVSTKEQVKNLSLTTQQARWVDFCSGNAWPVVKIFRDEGESAKTADRPAFQQMLAYCKSKKNVVEFVVVHDLSRFSRNVEDQVSVIGHLKAMGVRLRSAMENVDETAAGKLMTNIYGAFNQFDNDRKSERTKLGMQRAATMGRFPHKAALGYINLRNQTGPNLIPDPDRAPLILKGFELFSEGVRTKSETLRLLNLLGLRTHAGRELTPQTFEKILRNPI